MDSVFAPVIGSVLVVCFSWLLNQHAQRRQLVQERKKPLGRALAILLRVHWGLHFLNGLMEMRKTSDSELLEKYLQREKIELGKANSLQVSDESYNEAVGLISEYDPVLAFELYGKSDVHTIYLELSESIQHADSSEQNAAALKVAEAYGDYFLKRLKPQFETLLLDVAKQFNKRAYQDLKAHFDSLNSRLMDLPDHSSPISKNA